MKKIFFAGLVTGLFMIGSSGIAEATPIITDGLVAAYEFNGNANDSIGNNDGIVYGASLTTDRFGNADSAYSFDGSDDWIKIPENSAFSFQDFTISVWFQTTSDQQQGILQSTDGNRSGLTGYGITFRGTPPNSPDVERIVGASRAEEQGDKNKMWADFSSPLENSWHNVTLVRDTSNEDGYLYFDGVLVATGTDPDPDLTVTPQSYIRFGHQYDGSLDCYFEGKMDDIYFYNRALSASEIKSLYAVPVPAKILLHVTGLVVIAGLSNRFL